MSSRHTDELRQGAIVELRCAAAYRDGYDSAVERLSWRRNPWRGDAERATERVLAKMWQRGYSRRVDEVLQIS